MTFDFLPSSARRSALSDTPQRDVSWRHQVFLLRRAAVAWSSWARIPTVPLEDLFPGISGMTVSVSHSHNARGLPHGDAYVLSLITAYLSPDRVFEIGTASGEGTLLMARQALDARIDTLDLGDATPSFHEQRADPPIVDLDAIGRAYRESPHASSVTQHFGDSVTFDYSPFRGNIDLVFVDGAHTYEFVRADSRTALTLVRSGGVIVWDDCHLYHPGISKALLELLHEGQPVSRIQYSRLAVLRASA